MAGTCEVCGAKLRSSRYRFCAHNPDCRKAFKISSAKNKANYQRKVKSGEIVPQAITKSRRCRGHQPPSDEVPNGHLCQRCRKPLTGARRINCFDCEYELLKDNRTDGDYIFGSVPTVEELAQYLGGRR